MALVGGTCEESGSDTSEPSSSSEETFQLERFTYPAKPPGKKSKKFNRPDLKEEKKGCSKADSARAAGGQSVAAEPEEPEEDRNPNANNNPSDGVRLLSAGTSTPSVLPPCQCPDAGFYTRGDYVGAETRHQEFKEGLTLDDTSKDYFGKQVGRYMCGFLNSGGGVLRWGVDDCGKVKGQTFPRKQKEKIEDIVREEFLSIETPRGGIKVSRDDYIIRFVEVKQHTKPEQLKYNLYVLEVCVSPRAPIHDQNSFYRYRKVVYVRRDGSLQTVQNY